MVKKLPEGNPSNIINPAVVPSPPPEDPADAVKPAGSVRVYHPAFADVFADVAPGDVDGWTAQGWRKTPLK